MSERKVNNVLDMTDDEFAIYLHEQGGCIWPDFIWVFSRTFEETKDEIMYWISNFPGNVIWSIIESNRNVESSRKS